ncbi:MAG TPA: vWA domain-containing protein [Halothiobacillus sp.]|nr:vWA domain-containing protein [Halothiobacillus sp.]
MSHKHLVGFLLLLLSSLPAVSVLAQTPPELHVLIDVSGSMKQTDPTNLRRPALRLLGDLLPPAARIGIWFFGDRITPILPTQIASDVTKARVRNTAAKIRSNEPFTDIPAALEAAATGWGNDTDRNILLLSDGMVDISKDKAINAQAQARLLNEIVPRLQAAHIRVHTIALSKDADSKLLAEIADRTGGIFVAADSAAALQRAFLKIFEAAAPRDGLPLVDNKFVVDKSVKELTILAFRDKSDTPNSLKTPDGKLIDEKSSHALSNWRWDSSGGRDLITIEQPQDGEWQIIGAKDPDNRALIITDLKLNVTAIPTRIYPGELINSTLQLTNHDVPVTQPALTQTIKAVIQERRDTEVIQSIPLNDSGADPDIIGGDGKFDFQLNLIDPAGVYSMVATAESPTFQRSWRQNFAMAPNPPIELKAITLTPSAAAHTPPSTKAAGHGAETAPTATAHQDDHPAGSSTGQPAPPPLIREVRITQDPTVIIPERGVIDGKWECVGAKVPDNASAHAPATDEAHTPAAVPSSSTPVHWVLKQTTDTFPVPLPADRRCSLSGTLTAELTTNRPMTLRLLPLIVPALLSPVPPSEHHDAQETVDHEAVPRSGLNWILIGTINLGLLLVIALGIWLWRRSAKNTIKQLLAEAKTA